MAALLCPLKDDERHLLLKVSQPRCSLSARIHLEASEIKLRAILARRLEMRRIQVEEDVQIIDRHIAAQKCACIVLPIWDPVIINQVVRESLVLFFVTLRTLVVLSVPSTTHTWSVSRCQTRGISNNLTTFFFSSSQAAESPPPDNMRARRVMRRARREREGEVGEGGREGQDWTARSAQGARLGLGGMGKRDGGMVGGEEDWWERY